MNAQMNGGPQVGYGQGATQARPVNPTLIGTTTDEIGNAVTRAFRAANALREFNDGIQGSEPETPDNFGNKIAGGGADMPPRGIRLANEVASLHSALAALERQIERLNRV